MLNIVGKFWDENKDTIKNITIAVAVPVAVVALIGIRNLNKFIDDKGLADEYYYEDKSSELEEA
jgi:hypothetical protein